MRSPIDYIQTNAGSAMLYTALALFASTAVRAEETQRGRDDASAIVNSSQAAEAIAAVDRLVQAARIYDQREMEAASMALAEMGAPAVPALHDAIGDFDDNVRWQAIVALGRIGPAARSSIPRLCDALNDDIDPDVRAAAAEALGLLDAKSADAMRRLRVACDDPHALVRASSLWSVWQLTRQIKLLPTLIALLEDKDRLVCERVQRHLAAIGVPAVTQLTAHLRDRDHRGRHYAAEVLGRIGPLAQAATPVLITCLTEDDARVPLAASKALAGIGATTVPFVIKYLESDTTKGRTAAVEALASIGSPAQPALILLLSEIQVDDKRRRLATIRAIGNTRTSSDTAENTLLCFLGDQDEDIRGAVCAALGQCAGTSITARERLAQVAQHDPIEFVRLAAASAIR